MAKNVDLPWDDKSGQRSPKPIVIPFDSGRRGRNDFRPVDSEYAEPGASSPRSRPRRLAGAGPIFLLAIATLCGLYTGLTYKKSMASPKSQGQLQAGPKSQPSSPLHSVSKPSPNPPVVIAQAERGILPEEAPHAMLNPPASSAPHYHPMRYEATHKKAFGGCTGQLELTSAKLQFRCPNEADLNIPIGSIAKVHKDGVVLASGEKYHFLIANHTKDQVEAIFILWLDTVQRSRT